MSRSRCASLDGGTPLEPRAAAGAARGRLDRPPRANTGPYPARAGRSATFGCDPFDAARGAAQLPLLPPRRRWLGRQPARLALLRLATLPIRIAA